MADQYPLYIALRDLMVKSAPGTRIGKDVVGECTLNVAADVTTWKDPIWFGTVRLTGARVTYYLPPLATKEGRDVAVPPGLQKIAQSKTAFVFHDVEPERFAELEVITRAVAQAFTK